MIYRIIFWVGLLSCLLLVAACYMPWIHINSINETLTGMNVKPFVTGNNYGKAGKFIIVLTSLVIILMIIPRVWAKRLNLFLSALLFAFCIRSFVIFSGSLFEGEVERKMGLFLVLFLPFIILVSNVFSKVDEKIKNGN
jgi:hypothetical protein